MKKPYLFTVSIYLITLIILFIGLSYFLKFMSNCDQRNEYERKKFFEEIDCIYRGDHELIKMFNTKKTITDPGSFNGFFILGAGSIKGHGSKSTTNNTVTFSWKNNNDEYVTSSLPLTKVRIRIDDKVKNPLVRFKWSREPHVKDITERIIYMVIVCRNKEWVEDINMPDLRNGD